VNTLRVGVQALVVLVVLASGALAQDGSVGSITVGSGEIVVIRAAGDEEPAGVGTPIFQQDQIFVGPDGSATVTFIDETLLTLGANSALIIDEMVFDPASQANSGLLSLAGGVMGLVSGQIVKSGDMTVTTPVSTIGIRGTAILIDTGFTVSRSSSGGFIVNATGTGGEAISLVFSADGTVGLVTVTTADQTVTLSSFGGTVFVSHLGGVPPVVSDLSADEISARFGAVLLALNDAARSDLTDPANEAEAGEVKRTIDDLLDLLRLEEDNASEN